MSHRIAPPSSALTRDYRRPRESLKRPTYLEWIRSLPCAISGRRPVEAAHLSTASIFYGHPGRAKGTKAADFWALPLAPDLHREQHAGNEIDFWRDHGTDPHLLAVVLRMLWEQHVPPDYAEEVMALHRPFSPAGDNATLAAGLARLRESLAGEK